MTRTAANPPPAAGGDRHRDLTDEQSERLNARLVLLLSNHIGDIAVLKEALALARRDA